MKSLLLFIAVSAIMLSACNNQPSTATAEKTDSTSAAIPEKEKKELRNREIALQSVQGFNTHNPDEVLKNASPDFIDYGPGGMHPIKGIDSGKAAMKEWLLAFPDVKGEDFRVVADGDLVMVWGKWSGTWKGDFMKQKSTGKSFKFPDVDIFKFNDEGKIIEHHSIQTPEAMALQVGMKMK